MNDDYLKGTKIIDLEIYINETKVASYLSISTYTLRKWRRRGYVDELGTLPPKAYRFGRQIRYKLSELKVWIQLREIRHIHRSSDVMGRDGVSGRQYILHSDRQRGKRNIVI